MKPAPFAYYDPKTLPEAIGLLGALDNAKVLAGGQSLMPMMNFRVLTPANLIDLNKIEALSGIQIEGSKLRIGATARQRTLEFSEPLARLCPLFRAGLEHVGHRQTRNRGTLGGSLAHADPSAELPNICSALSARIEILGPRGTRIVPFAEFGVGFMATAVEPDEILCGVEIDCWALGHGYSFQEYARRRGDFAVVGVAALLELRNGLVARAAISVCGVAETPLRVPELEEILLGKALEEEDIEELAEIAGSLSAMSDHHVSAEYRQHLIRVLTERALREALRRSEVAP